MKTIRNGIYDEERALYGLKDIEVVDSKFDGPKDGESALKECENVIADNCFFNLRYPFWHVNKCVIKNSHMTDLCRAALWYDDDVRIENTKMYGIKALRECKNIVLNNVDAISPEFLWRCENINIDGLKMDSVYPLFECKNIKINNMDMKGKYSFQYVENMTVSNSVFDTKDAFWHTKNVTIIDSVVKGEYLGWYSENLKFVRCKIIGTQPLCYCKNLILEDCTMEACDLSFERSEVNAVIKGSVDGVKNPKCGYIKADEIKDLLIESSIVNKNDTKIEASSILVYNEI